VRCTSCGYILSKGTESCPDCGAPVRPRRADRAKRSDTVATSAAPEHATSGTDPAPERNTRRALVIGTLAVAVILLAAAAGVVYLSMLPSSRTGVRVAKEVTSVATPSVEPTVTPEQDQAAAEAAVRHFYEAMNSLGSISVRSLVTSDTLPTINDDFFRHWVTTTFSVARSEVDSNTATVWGHESQRAFGSKTLGVQFTLQRVGAAWLVQSWQPVDEGTIKGAVPPSAETAAKLALDQATATDVVNTLMQGRQVGDAGTIRIVTTPAFQTANPAWLNGINNSKSFTSYRITGVKKKGKAFVVSVSETWSGKTRASVYTVVLSGQSILVNAWSHK
jgi:hypothetical protein